MGLFGPFPFRLHTLAFKLLCDDGCKDSNPQGGWIGPEMLLKGFIYVCRGVQMCKVLQSWGSPSLLIIYCKAELLLLRGTEILAIGGFFGGLQEVASIRCL